MKITLSLCTLFIACILNTNAEPTTAAPLNATIIAADESDIEPTTVFANAIMSTDIDSELSFTTIDSDALSVDATDSIFDDTEPAYDGTVDSDTSDDEDIDSMDDNDGSDECEGLTQTQCFAVKDEETGDAECAYNVETGDCYSVTRKAGIYGSGNYDDGFIAAQNAAKQESSDLYTVVGILGGIIGALIIVVASGAYYFYHKAGINRGESTRVQIMDKDKVLGQSISITHDQDINDTTEMIV